MKKLILLAAIAFVMVASQPVKAQLSVNINIGTRPYYEPTYYGYSDYYVPAPRVYHQRTVVVQRPVYVPTRVYHTSYARPTNRYYTVKSYSKHNYNGKGNHGKGHGRGKH